MATINLVRREGFEPPSTRDRAERATVAPPPRRSTFAAVIHEEVFNLDFFFCDAGAGVVLFLRTCHVFVHSNPSNLALRAGLKPATFRLTAGRSVIELPESMAEAVGLEPTVALRLPGNSRVGLPIPLHLNTGGSGGTRTLIRRLRVGTSCQLNYRPESGASPRSRTENLSIKSRML